MPEIEATIGGVSLRKVWDFKAIPRYEMKTEMDELIEKVKEIRSELSFEERQIVDGR